MAPTADAASAASERIGCDSVSRIFEICFTMVGLKEGTVIRVIEARSGNYVLIPDAVSALKAAGVPQSVITAMSAKMNRA